MFGLLNDRYSMETLVSQVMNRGYGIDFYAGDEDNGEMGAWYVMSAMGLFSAAPGSMGGEYVLGTPMFDHIRVHYDPILASDGMNVLPGPGDYHAQTENKKHITRLQLLIQQLKSKKSIDSFSVSKEDRGHLDILALGSSVDNIHIKQIYLNKKPVGSFTRTGEKTDRIPGNIVSYNELMMKNGVSAGGGGGGGGGDNVIQFIRDIESVEPVESVPPVMLYDSTLIESVLEPPVAPAQDSANVILNTTISTIT